MLNNSHPGEIIRAEIMEPLGLAIEDAAQRFGVPADVLSDVLASRIPITQELAQGLELAGYSTARFK